MHPILKCAINVSAAITFLNTAPIAAQTVSLVAGTGFATNALNPLGDGLRAVNATFNRPHFVLVRADGTLLIADTDNHRIRKVDLGGTITTFAGTGTVGFTAMATLATAANLKSPRGLAEDAAGNIYIGNTGSIQKVSPSGQLSTIAGDGTPTNSSGDGSDAALSRVKVVYDLKLDAAGNLFFCDGLASVIRKINQATNIISNVAGSAASGDTADGLAAAGAPIRISWGLLLEPDGSIIFSETFGHRIRKISSTGILSTIAGTGTPTSTGDGGLAINATMIFPFGIVKDAAGNLFVSDLNSHRVRKITPDGRIDTILGSRAVPGLRALSTATNAGDNGLATSATVNFPAGLALDGAGNLYIASVAGHQIRKITFPPPPLPSPSVFKSFANTITADLGTISPEGEQTVPFGGIVQVSVTAKPRHVLRVASNCDYVKTSAPIALVPNGTGTETYAVTVNGPCAMEATFTPLIPRANVNSEAAANALFTATERSQTYVPPATIAQTSSVVNAPVKLKAWVTDIAGVPYPSATNVITFKANGVAIAGCVDVPLTLRASNVIHIREANCVTSFSPAGNVTIASEFAGDTYNFPAVSGVLNHSVTLQ